MYALTAIILTFGPISGAHLNPVVTMVLAILGRIPRALVPPYLGAQIAGAAVGTWLANAMFELPVWQVSQTPRTGAGQWLSEGIATLGLMLTILGCLHRNQPAVPYAVGLYITAAYWFTASTSFANPAVTVARSLTGTFAGIRVVDVGPFVAAQLAAAVAAMVVLPWLIRSPEP